MTQHKHNAYRRTSVLLFSVLLFCQACMFFTAPWPSALDGDQVYYVQKSTEILSHGWFRTAGPEHYRALKGKVGFYSDYRPPGYPLFLAAFGVNTATFASRRILVCTVQFALLLLSQVLAFVLAVRFFGDTRFTLIAAIALGLQAWFYETSRHYLADSVTASTFTLGLLLLVFFSGRRERWAHFLSGLFFGISASMRPEMLFLAAIPLLVFAAITFLKWTNLTFPKISILVFGLFFLGNISYRVWFDGNFLARFARAAPGLWSWTCTWPAFGAEKQSIRFKFYSGELLFSQIPERAFSSMREKDQVKKAFRLRQARSAYDQEMDLIFQNLAQDRVREMPVKAFLLPRLFFTLQLWVNPVSNDFTEFYVKGIPSVLRYLFWRAVAALKSFFLILGITSLWMFLKFQRWRDPQWFDVLWMMAFATVVIRTIALGLMNGSNEHRYMLNAWPCLSWCAFYGLFWFPKLSELSRTTDRQKIAQVT